MSIGLRIYTKFDRPDPAIIDRLKDIPVANLDDNMGRLYAVDAGIKPIGKCQICGPAFTVKSPGGDNLMFHKALDMAQEGDVIVVSGIGLNDRAFSGDLMAELALARKLGGFVIDGYVRDLEGHQAIDFPVYARGIQPNGPYKNGPGEINVPVALGGQVVMPGDIIVGDADGLVVIPVRDAEEVCAAGEKMVESEEGYRRDYRTGTVGPRKWVADKLADLQVEVLEEKSYGGAR